MDEKKTATTKTKKRTAKKLAGDRANVVLARGEERLSFSVGPNVQGGSTLRVRHRRGDGEKVRTAVENHPSFDVARQRARNLADAAQEKGWTEAKQKLTPEDLL